MKKKKRDHSNSRRKTAAILSFSILIIAVIFLSHNSRSDDKIEIRWDNGQSRRIEVGDKGSFSYTLSIKDRQSVEAPGFSVRFQTAYYGPILFRQTGYMLPMVGPTRVAFNGGGDGESELPVQIFCYNFGKDDQGNIPENESEMFILLIDCPPLNANPNVSGANGWITLGEYMEGR